jgi:hypothetical protein
LVEQMARDNPGWVTRESNANCSASAAASGVHHPPAPQALSIPAVLMRRNHTT